MSRSKTSAAEPLSAEVMRQIVEAVQGIRFGSVQITIHDAQVVQIEKVEKMRYRPMPVPAAPPQAPGRLGS